MAELLRDVGERRWLPEVATGPHELGVSQPPGAQCDERRGDVRESLVHRQALRTQRVVEVGRQPVEDRVAGFVRDDVT